MTRENDRPFPAWMFWAPLLCVAVMFGGVFTSHSNRALSVILTFGGAIPMAVMFVFFVLRLRALRSEALRDTRERDP